jgi:hypothetical protein
MRIWVFVVVLACGGRSNEPAKPIGNTASPTARPAVEPERGLQRPVCPRDAACALKHIEYFSAKICACSDKTCADRVNDDYTAWGIEMARTATPEEARSASREQTQRMMDAATKYTECYTKLAMDASAGSAAP